MSPHYLTEGTKINQIEHWCAPKLFGETKTHAFLRKQHHMRGEVFPYNAILQRKARAKRVIAVPEVLQGGPIWGSESS